MAGEYMRKNIVVAMLVIVIIFLVVQERMTNYSHPKQHLIKNFPLIQQPDDITCGPTSVQMVLKSRGISTTLDQVKSETKTEWIVYGDKHLGMTSPDYIPRAMNAFGLPAKMRSGQLHHVKHYVGKGDPVIVLLRSGKLTWHYVVVVGYDEKTITVADPGYGDLRVMSVQDFESAWQFTSDMRGRPTVSPCGVCDGTGRWISFDIGPLSICEICSGSGNRVDYVGALVSTADVSPRTMIVMK